MIPALLIYAIAYVLIIGTLLIAALIQLKKRRLFSGSENISLEEITVIIPFRDEENRIGTLLKCLSEQSKLPDHIIFADDHSTDESAASIRNQSKSLQFEVMGLPEGEYGKKAAIRHAINQVRTEFTLTLDADVKLDKYYFEQLESLGKEDLWILPVAMTGKSWKEQSFSIDTVLSNALNRGVSFFFRPIMASGANLLFRTDSYREVSAVDHLEISSGDDMFLLRDFRNAGKTIQLSSDSKYAVRAEAPATLKEMVDQRIRWISKTQKVGDPLATAIGVIQMIFSLAFIGLLLYTANHSAVAVLLFISVKLIFDTLLLGPHFIHSGNIKALVLFPLYDLLYPVYALFIGVASMSYKPAWKGRKIST